MLYDIKSYFPYLLIERQLRDGHWNLDVDADVSSGLAKQQPNDGSLESKTNSKTKIEIKNMLKSYLYYIMTL